MSDQDTSVDTDANDGDNAQEVDPIKNVKAEMDRKMKNLTEQMTLQNQELIKAITSLKAAPVQQEKKQEVSLADLQYSDPEAYARRIADMAAEAASSRVNASNAVNNTLAQMVSEYPELGNQNSEMYQKAVSAYNALSDSEKNSSSGIRLAIREAAADLGLVPASKRRKQDDDFSFGGDVSNNQNNQNKKREKKVEISEETLALSKLLGRDPNDPKVKAGLEKAIKRKSFQKYE
jgi:hypothetical protein